MANNLFSSLFAQETAVQSRFVDMAGNFPMFLMWVLIGWMVGGFFEEMIFRGFILGHLEKIFGHFKWATALAVLAAGRLVKRWMCLEPPCPAYTRSMGTTSNSNPPVQRAKKHLTPGSTAAPFMKRTGVHLPSDAAIQLFTPTS